MKVAHIGDAHLGYRQYGSRQRELDFIAALNHVATATINAQCTLAIWPGDLFDSARPGPEAVAAVRSIVERLSASNCMSVGIDGNHDMDPAGSWLQVVGIHDLERQDDNILRRGSTNIAGFRYRRPSEMLVTLSEWATTLQDEKAPPVDIVVLHQLLGDLVPFGSEVMTAEVVATILGPVGVRYVAMGDCHAYIDATVKGVRFVYPGSTEMTDINEDHDKVFSMLDITPDALEVIGVPVATRPIVERKIDTEEELQALITEQFDVEPLLVVKINAALADAKNRIYGRFTDLPIKLHAYTNDNDLAEVFDTPAWEREKASVGLGDAIDSSFAPTSEENQLVRRCLENPDNLSGIIDEYLNEKGITNAR
jgi:DNA repair exonuclease SbcCD nuclease subunit